MASKKRGWKKRKWPETPWILWAFRDKARAWNRGRSKWVIHGRYETEAIAKEAEEKIKKEPWASLYQDTKITSND